MFCFVLIKIGANKFCNNRDLQNPFIKTHPYFLNNNNNNTKFILDMCASNFKFE